MTSDLSVDQHLAYMREPTSHEEMNRLLKERTLEGLGLIGKVEELQAMLKEVADELAEWIEHNYQHTKDHPAMRGRYERDMETVYRAWAMLHDER